VVVVQVDECVVDMVVFDIVVVKKLVVEVRERLVFVDEKVVKVPVVFVVAVMGHEQGQSLCASSSRHSTPNAHQ
jgi:response regulator RpfG family c-di-GMP phosphodiesterase